MILLSTSGYAQLITVLVVFVVVLAVTAFVTRWMANYQKGVSSGRNIEVIETTRIANNKYMQIIRVGNTYKVLAISKDSTEYLGDIDPSELKEQKTGGNVSAFKSMFDKALKKDKDSSADAKDDEL